MVKDGIVSGRVDKTLIAKAKEQNLNISEAIEQALEEQTSDATNLPVLVIKPFVILINSRNYIVAELEENYIKDSAIKPVVQEDIKKNTNTYHISLNHALLQANKRLLNEKLKSRCKTNPMDLKEMALFLEEHYKWFVDIVKGM